MIVVATNRALRQTLVSLICVFISTFCIKTACLGKTVHVVQVPISQNSMVFDASEIQRAIDSISLNDGPSEVIIPSGTYMLPSSFSSIELRDKADLIVKGSSNVVIFASPDKTVFRVEGSRNVSIENLNIDRSPLAYVQATVLGTWDDGRKVQVQITPPYVGFASDVIPRASWLIVFESSDAKTWGMHGVSCAFYNVADPSVCWPPQILSTVRVSADTWQVTLNTPLDPAEIDKQVVLWDITKSGSAVSVSQTNTFSVLDVNYFPGGSGGGFLLSRNSGVFRFDHFYIGARPGSDQHIAGHGGGMVFNNHISLQMKNVSILDVWDDGINIGANFARVAERRSDSSIVVDTSQADDFRPGDLVAVWNWATKTEQVRLRLRQVECRVALAGLCILTLDGNVGDVVAGTVSNPPVYGSNDNITRVIDLNSAGDISVVASTFKSLHARGILAKANTVYITDSLIKDTVMAGILIGPEFDWNEGPCVNHFIISGNRFLDVSGSNIIINNKYCPLTLSDRISGIVGNMFIDYGRYKHGIMGNPTMPILADGETALIVHGNLGRSISEGLHPPVHDVR